MKTTLEIPDETFHQAKVQAALQNIPLRQFVTEAVEEKLAKPTERFATPAWMAGFGGLADLADESRRLMALVEEEFESLDSENEA
jgi:hypothetical protein